MVAAELARLQEREKFLEREVRAAQRNMPNAAIALDEEVVTRMLGEEAARILATAREGASAIKQRADEMAARVVREANDEAERVRDEAYQEADRIRRDASADAEAEISMAKQQGRDMVNETRAYRERVLSELARRRELARQQIEQLVHGRDRLMQAFERARLAAIDVMSEMSPLGEPEEYVNLSPTTGPVPLMVPNTPAPDDTVVDSEIVDDVVVEVEVIETVSIEDMGDTVEVVDFFGESAADTDTEAHDGATQLVEVIDAPDAEIVETEVVGTEVVAAEEVESPSDVAVSPVDSSDTVEADQVDEVIELVNDHLAPVVSLFAAEPVIVEEATLAAGQSTAEQPTSEAGPVAKPSVDDLFAKLRASRTEEVVSKADSPAPEAVVMAEPVPTPVAEKKSKAKTAPVEEPVAVMPLAVDTAAFERRDAELTPLIVAAGRKLKRVLADEQNDVLHALRGRKGFDPSTLLPPLEEHLQRYVESVHEELQAAALAGASSISKGSSATLNKAIGRSNVLEPALELLTGAVVQPLRERIERAVVDTGADATELGNAVRAIYREWKMQRIDEHLDDVALSAFGHGQLAVLKPGTSVCWAVDPNGPACPDAEDNSLAGAVDAGSEFPTAHRCAPAHEGCRCMLQLAPR